MDNSELVYTYRRSELVTTV